MGRYRAPTVPGSQFITPTGCARLRAELDTLWREERPRVTQAVQDAAAQGDRSENAEYIYGKRRLREIDSRVKSTLASAVSRRPRSAIGRQQRVVADADRSSPAAVRACGLVCADLRPSPLLRIERLGLLDYDVLVGLGGGPVFFTAKAGSDCTARTR